jgi:hypothetical protein
VKAADLEVGGRLIPHARLLVRALRESVVQPVRRGNTAMVELASAIIYAEKLATTQALNVVVMTNSARSVATIATTQAIRVAAAAKSIACRIPHNRTQYDPTYRTPVLK